MQNSLAGQLKHCTETKLILRRLARADAKQTSLAKGCQA